MKALRSCLLLVGSLPACAWGQGNDPFHGSDPFGRRESVLGDPVDIDILVRDHAGQPVAGARIVGFGIRIPLITDPQGHAVWSTGTRNVRRLAGKKDHLILTAVPPREAFMPTVTRRFTVDDVLEKTLEFRTRPGVRLTGRVIGRQDRKPLNGVLVRLRGKSSLPTAKPLVVSTNERGEWSTVIPRVDASISLIGAGAGYKLRTSFYPGPDYQRTIEVPADAREWKVPEFEIEQIPDRTVHVIDEDGQPVPGARVAARQQHWLDDQIVTWRDLSEVAETDADGTCQLKFFLDSWDVGMLEVSANAGSLHLAGRVDLDAGTTGPLRIVAHRLCRIRGRLNKAGKPATGVKVVLYEALQRDDQRWTSIGMRGTESTDQQGRFLFHVPRGVRYLLALSNRNADGVQATVHRITQPITEAEYTVGDIDIAALLNQ